MHEVVRPELVNRVLDQLDERDEKAPRVRAVHNQPLQKHPRDLLLHRLGVGLSEQVQEATAEVVRVAVRVAELVGDRVQE